MAQTLNHLLYFMKCSLNILLNKRIAALNLNEGEPCEHPNRVKVSTGMMAVSPVFTLSALSSSTKILSPSTKI